MRRVRFVLAAVATVFALGAAPVASASYAIYVGRNLTASGATLIGGTGDEASSHWLEIVPHQHHAPGTTIRVGAGKDAHFLDHPLPGELRDIPQVPDTAAYLTMNYTDYAGFPAPLTNGGLNEYGVAARDVWSPSRPALQAMTPRFQRGLNYSDLSRIAMERAHTAREAVEIVGRLIDEYGYATYGYGNSHLFADATEGWVLLNFPGGKGLWIAERLGPDDIRMSYPGYVLEVPVDLERHPDKYLASKNFVSFAIEKGWYDPKAGKPFNVNVVYQEGKGRSAEVEIIEGRLQARARTGKITLREFMDTVRDPLISRDWSGYGQVAELKARVARPELNLLWVAPTSSVTAPFVPYWIGVERIPPEYGAHRYLSRGESEGFVLKDFQVQEASRFAFRTFKRLLYYTCDRPAKFLPEVTEALTAFENASMQQSVAVEAKALRLFSVGEAGMARETLTTYSSQRALEALTLGEQLLGSIEARHRLLYGYRVPRGTVMSGDDEHGEERLVDCLSR